MDAMTLTLTIMMMMAVLGEGVRITEVSIPRTVEIGQENIILNCDYHFDQEEAQQLEIKWYFNKDPSPFFQWIAGLPDAKVSAAFCNVTLLVKTRHVLMCKVAVTAKCHKYQISSFKPSYSPKSSGVYSETKLISISWWMGELKAGQKIIRLNKIISSSRNPFTRYRAIKITRPTIDMAGKILSSSKLSYLLFPF